MKKYNTEFQKVSDVAIIGITKHGADGFGSTGGITKVTKLGDSDSENQMPIFTKKKIIAQADWNELEKKNAAAQMMN